MTHWSEQLWLWLVDDLIRKSGNETYLSNQNGTQPIETALHGLPVPLHHRQHFTYYYLANASNSSYQQPQILIEWTLVNLSNPGHSRQLNLLVCPSVSCKLISVLYLFAIRHCLLASLLLLLAYIAIVALIFLSIRACCQLYTNHRQRNNNQQQPRAHHIQPGKSRSSHSGSQLVVVCSCQHRPPIEPAPNSAQRRRIKLLAPDKLEQQYQQDQVDPTLIPKECTDGEFVPADGSMQLVDVSQASNYGPNSRSLVPMQQQQQCSSSGTNAPLLPLTAALQTTAPIVVAFNQIDRSGSRSRDNSTYYDPVSVAYPRFPPTSTAGLMPMAITENLNQTRRQLQPPQQCLQPMSSPEPSDTGGENTQDIPNISLMPAAEFISYCDYQNEHQSSSEFGRYRPASSSSDSTLVMADCRSMQTALLRTSNRKVSNRITTTL